jgi:hypothetical protein
MSRALISRSADLKRLRDDGYDVEIKASYLLVKGVPYVTSSREIKRAILVSKLNLAGDMTARPDDHTVQFTGEMPCHADGSAMAEIIASSQATTLDKDLVTHHTFSQKPQCGHYTDYYEKMTTYVAMLVGHAQAIDVNATARVNRVDEPEEEDSPFQYLDTASSRAEITAVTRKLRHRRVAIIGLGGTGAYVLDYVSKTPVQEIHIFDGDKLQTHNAFRSPGAASVEELRGQPFKTAYYKERYTDIHKGIVEHAVYVTAENAGELAGMNFVFVCVDRPPEKAPILAKLKELGIPFVDVGMGIYVKNGSLIGTLRVTTGTPQKHDHLADRISLEEADGANEYDSNIQIAELNAFNACMAVIKWKQLCGFYVDLENEHFSAYSIDCALLVSGDFA